MPESSSNHLRTFVRRICVEAAAPTDAQLWEQFVGTGDQQAFEALVRRHGSMVFACARRVLSDRSEAEDVFQATFLTLARAGAQLRHPEAMTSWLYQTAFRIAQRARTKRPLTGSPDSEPATMTNESDLAWREVRGILDEELQRLPDSLRSPLMLCYLNGLSRDEAARQLGCSFDQLKRRLEKGRETLRHRLERRGVAGAGLALTVLSPELLQATLPEPMIENTLALVVGREAAVPATVALLMTPAGTLTKGLAMKSIAVALLCAGAGVWVFARGEAEPQEKEKPPVVNPAKPEAKEPWPALEPYDNQAQEARACTGQQSAVSLNNLKIIMLAVHNHHDTYGYLPSDILDKDGKPLLSWRVALLPFLDNAALYNEFKLDQPWDSEHNAKLMAKMPRVFRLSFEPKGGTQTYYQAFSGRGTPLQAVEYDADALKALRKGKEAGGDAGSAGSGDTPGGAGSNADPAPNEIQPPKPGGKKGFAKTKISSVTDGLSNTIGVVEAGPPVAWTKPGGISFDAKKPLPKMPGPFSNVLHIGMMDGAAYPIKRNMPDDIMRLYAGMNDGKSVPDLKGLKAALPADTPGEKAELETQVQENLQRIKRLLELHERELSVIAELIQTSGSLVDSEQIRGELQRRETRLRDDIKSIEAALAAKKKGPPKPGPSDSTPAKK